MRISARLLMAMSLLVPFSTAMAATTAQVARPFLQALLVELDLPKAYGRYADPNFIEHNPEMGNGLAAKLAYFNNRQAQEPRSAPPGQWASVVDHVLIDGDLLAVHRHVFQSPEDPGRVFVDIWRVAQGRIVEHWDVIQAVPAGAASAGPTMWCARGSDYRAARALGDTLRHPSCGPNGPQAHGTRSRQIIQRYTALLAKGEIEQAVRRYNAPTLVQHSPVIAAGLGALTQNLSAHFSPDSPVRQSVQVVRLLAQGDLVLVHRHGTSPDAPQGYVAADLFRLEDGRIAEHWDVKQSVPASSVNGHAMW